MGYTILKYYVSCYRNIFILNKIYNKFTPNHKESYALYEVLIAV